MVKKNWSLKAFESLKEIYTFYDDKDGAKKLIGEIVQAVDNLSYTHQYQVDEILGNPYRRIVTKRHRVIYKVKDKDTVEILYVMDNRQSPSKLQREIKKKDQ